MDAEYIDSELDALIRTGEVYFEVSFGFRPNFEIATVKEEEVDIGNKFKFVRGNIQDRSALFLYHLGDTCDVVNDFIKFRNYISEYFKCKIIALFVGNVSRILRRQLIDQKIGFFVPGSQLYFPEVFLDLRDRPMGAGRESRTRISPLAQTVILATLLGERLEGVNLTELAERFRVSVMSTSRVMDELEALEVARAKFVGRERCLHFPVRGRLLWEELKDRLRSPVRKVRFVKGSLPEAVARLSGASALAFYAGGDEPGARRYAISEAMFNQLRKNSHIELTDVLEEERIEIEVWSYDPCVLSRDGVVDPLSLYLSRRYDADENIGNILDKVLASIEWS